MREYLAEGRSLPEAYHRSLELLYEKGEIAPCPDYNTNQKELSMTLFVSEPLSEPLISRCFIGGYRELEQYRQEMLDGILDFEIERGNWAYTYHSRMAEQFPFIERELRRNPSSRRAVIDVRDWRHDAAEGNENPACLQHIQYFIRGGALHCKVLFRSNDACKATYMNAFALIMLQKRFADSLGCAMGSYTHRANSYHCYEKDFPLLEGYVTRIRSGDDVTFEYEEEWLPMMEEARPDIAKTVEKLKNGE
ncbi:MAG: hypothetical protein J5827_02485 [Oscillospiraceae bacterium]|nr:hypothetical protein [Oscillospiraceae bacterium]